MKVELIVDNREKAIIPLLKSPFDKNNLDIGDFQILVNDKLTVLIERKTLMDLSISIIDGRYREQKKRILAQSIPKVIYLIEGDMNHYKGSIPKDTIISTIVNCTLRDNINILLTSSFDETACLIDKMYKNLHNYEINTQCQISYQEASIQQKRNKNLTIIIIKFL